MQQSLLHRIFWGFILICGGIVFLLNQSGAISLDIGYLFSTFWPVLVILFGVQGLLLQRGSGVGWNAVVIVIGMFFLGRNLGWLDWSLGDLIRFALPAALIIAGLNMVFRGSRCGRPRHKWKDYDSGWNAVTPPPARGSYDIPPAPGQPGSHDSPLPPPPPPRPYDSPTAFGDDAEAGGANAAPDVGGDAYGTAPGRQDGPQQSGGDSAQQRDWYAANPADRHWQRRQERWERMQERMQERMERHHIRHQERHRARHAGRHAGREGADGDFSQHWQDYHRPPGHGVRGARMDHSRFIGDVHIGQDMWELQPMSISHFIGDTTIDLTRAQIPLGETRIYVSAFIGDVKAYVPGDHSVGVRVVSSCLIGDVKILEQKRGGLFNQMSAETPGFQDTDKQVVLIVSCFIGDVRVTKVG